MKHSDIEKIHATGLITAEQREQIIAHFQLKEGAGRFLTIISFLGAVLIASGIVLLISANWDEIPHGLKIASGLLLMLGAHVGGYYLRDVQGKYQKAGEALHLAGSGLFLANIALIGQIYHLSSRAPNAILLWWLGIAALPWLLRSKAQHILSLLAFGLWFGLEVNQRDGWIFFGDDQHQILLYSLLGLVYLGGGYSLRRTSFAEFAPPTENLGLLVFHLFSFPLTWGIFYSGHKNVSPHATEILIGLGVITLALLAWGVKQDPRLRRQWRWTWGLTLVGAVALLAGALIGDWSGSNGFFPGSETALYNWIAALALFVFCLLQIQVGIQTRSPYTVNLGIAFISLNLIATYITLIGSMARTGLMFLISGVFLIAFGIYLEKKRRALLQRMQTSTP
ncbi:MAG: DUF2157 domain-containing protein [Verrucomicrobia bacterium]|nr:DUF2157 domain-containing protein [Verrucomicrobiota bacterium]